MTICPSGSDYLCPDKAGLKIIPLPAFAIDLPNTVENTERIQGVLKALANRFDDESVKVDMSAARPDTILPLLGAPPSSASSSEHIRSGFTSIPQHLQPVTMSLLAELAIEGNPRSEAEPVDGNPDLTVVDDVQSRQDAINDDPAKSRGVQRFVAEECVLDLGVRMPTGTLYDGYAAFCYHHHLSPTTVSHFFRMLLTILPLILHRPEVHGVVTRGIRGIRLQSGGNLDADLAR